MGDRLEKKGVAFEELFHEYLTSRILGHLLDEPAVESIKPAMKNDFVTKESVVDPNLGGQQTRQVKRGSLSRNENILLEAINQIDRITLATLGNRIWRHHTPALEPQRAYLQPGNYPEHLQWIMLGMRQIAYPPIPQSFLRISSYLIFVQNRTGLNA